MHFRGIDRLSRVTTLSELCLLPFENGKGSSLKGMTLLPVVYSKMKEFHSPLLHSKRKEKERIGFNDLL